MGTAIDTAIERYLMLYLRLLFRIWQCDEGTIGCISYRLFSIIDQMKSYFLHMYKNVVLLASRYYEKRCHFNDKTSCYYNIVITTTSHYCEKRCIFNDISIFRERCSCYNITSRYYDIFEWKKICRWRQCTTVTQGPSLSQNTRIQLNYYVFITNTQGKSMSCVNITKIYQIGPSTKHSCSAITVAIPILEL